MERRKDKVETREEVTVERMGFNTIPVPPLPHQISECQDISDPILERCTNDNENKLLGCLYGVALGDAVGLSTEFLNKVQIAKHFPENEIIPFFS